MKIKKRNFENYLKFGHKRKFIHEFIYKKFLNKIKDKNKKTLWDIGCGNGSFLQYLNDVSEFRLFGSETDKLQLEFCKKNFKFSNFSYDDITKLPNKKLKEHADIICACGVNQIFDDHPKVIKNELARLKKGGQIILQGIFCSEDVDVLLKYKIFDKNIKPKNFTSGWNLFSISSTKEMLIKAGAKNVKIERVIFPKSLTVKPNLQDQIRSFTFKKDGKIEFKNILPILQRNYVISAIKK